MNVLKYLIIILLIFLFVWLGVIFILKAKEKSKKIIKSNESIRKSISSFNNSIDEVTNTLQGYNPILEKVSLSANKLNDNFLSKK